jgi:PAT family beta-lactamase induction signal transducer AmpG
VVAAGVSRLVVGAGREMRDFAVESFRSFLDTRGAYLGLLFALLPSGAMCLGLALQTNLAVELGLNDDQVAWMGLWTNVIGAAFMVLGGMVSDKFGRRRTLAVYLALMSPPVLYLAWLLQQHGWIMPVDTTQPNRPVPPAVLVYGLWIAVFTYAVAQGLMYGTRSAIFMDVTNPRVAATQFTAYMALLNFNIAYSATWQGIAVEALGYPKTMLLDAVLGPACIALLPWIRSVRENAADGGAPARARVSALVLGLACVAWLPYRLQPGAAGAAGPIVETFFTVVFVASAPFLVAGAAVLGEGARRLARLGGWMALPLLLMYARRRAVAGGPAEWPIRLLPVPAGAILMALALQSWRELRRPAATPT